MFRWFYHVESSGEYVPFMASITFLPGLAYLVLCGAALGLFLGIVSRITDQMPAKR